MADETQVNETAEDAVESTTEQAEQQVETDIQALYDQIAKLTDERDQLRDQALRAMADFQNFRKRNQQEMLRERQLATERLVVELLPVLDNFERTIQHAKSASSIDTLIEGVTAVERQLRSALSSQGVTRVASVGQPFDPEVHEALGVDVTEEYAEDTVSAELESGYKMGEKVIRPARVRVAKKG